MDRKAYWEGMYTSRESHAMSWYQQHPARSLQLIEDAGVGPGSEIIDVGGGDSTLVDALVERHSGHVTVLDLSRAALGRAQARLGSRSREVRWIEEDVTRAQLPRDSYDIWHDRAVFHFLTERQDRDRYVATAAAALRPGGTLILATFAPDGPARCSGLDVVRYSPEDIAAEFDGAFTLLSAREHVHQTPAGAEQRFTYAALRRGGSAPLRE